MEKKQYAGKKKTSKGTGDHRGLRNISNMRVLVLSV